MLYVFMGGGIGAVSRYLLGMLIHDSNFPLSTWLINCIGSFLIGFIACKASKSLISDSMLLLLKTGFCGGFTTFSTFTLESMQLIQNGKTMTSISYIVCSILGGMVCLLIGMKLGEQ